jgi:hypothetical protein
MNYDLIWKSITFFNFCFFLIWVCFTTYRAEFMNDDDFMAWDGSRGNTDRKDSVFSFAGRSLIFLIALISSLVLTIIFFVSYNYFIKPTLKCEKKKGIKSCKLVK